MRARDLKPGFFKNEGLAELGFGHRLLFEGLWCLADREGRLEDRPKRIKAEVFPYDDVDADGWLADLAARGFIVRYEVDGAQYVAIPAFAKHQKPHPRETPSMIPPPPGSGPAAPNPGKDVAKHNLGATQATPRIDLGNAKDVSSPAGSSGSSGSSCLQDPHAPPPAVPADLAAREQPSDAVPASAGRQGVTAPPNQQQAPTAEPKAIPRRPHDGPLDIAGEAHVGELLADAGFAANESNRRVVREAVRRRGWALVDTAFTERERSDFYSGRSGECQKAGNVGWLVHDRQLDALARLREEREQADAHARPQPPRFVPPPPPIRTPEGDAAALKARAQLHALFAAPPETSPPASNETPAPATPTRSPAA